MRLPFLQYARLARRTEHAEQVDLYIALPGLHTLQFSIRFKMPAGRAIIIIAEKQLAAIFRNRETDAIHTGLFAGRKLNRYFFVEQVSGIMPGFDGFQSMVEAHALVARAGTQRLHGWFQGKY